MEVVVRTGFDASIARLAAMTLDDNPCGNVQLVQQLLGIIEETVTFTYMRTEHVSEHGFAFTSRLTKKENGKSKILEHKVVIPVMN